LKVIASSKLLGGGICGLRASYSAIWDYITGDITVMAGQEANFIPAIDA
jgi:hypothetical protein